MRSASPPSRAGQGAQHLLHQVVRASVNWKSGVTPELFQGQLSAYDALSRPRQAQRSFDLLRHVVFRAYHSVPYYKRALDAAGIGPGELRTLDDLRRFPLLDRAQVQAAGRELWTHGSARLGARANATGGSTGTPMQFLNSLRSQALNVASERRVWGWYGVHPGARLGYLWGSDRDVPPEEAADQWKNRIAGLRRLNAFLLDDERCEAFYRILVDFRPELIYGYATALATFAAFLERTGRTLPNPPRVIRSTAEVLLPEHRALVQRAFGARVLNYYGGRDLGPVGAECLEQRGLHVFTDLCQVEVLRTDGTPCAPGETGEVVLTKLQEHAMPFVRYRTGDRAQWLDGACACGRAMPLLSSVEGRQGDFIQGPDGRKIHGEYFTHLFYGIHGVTRFQVRQPRVDALTIRVQCASPVAPAALERVRTEAARQFGGGDGAVTLELVAEIAPGASGKHRFVIPFEGA